MGQTIPKDLLFRAIALSRQGSPAWIKGMQKRIDQLNGYSDTVDIGYVQEKAREKVDMLSDKRLHDKNTQIRLAVFSGQQGFTEALKTLRSCRDDYKYILECLPRWYAVARAYQKAS